MFYCLKSLVCVRERGVWKEQDGLIKCRGKTLKKNNKPSERGVGFQEHRYLRMFLCIVCLFNSRCRRVLLKNPPGGIPVAVDVRRFWPFPRFEWSNRRVCHFVEHSTDCGQGNNGFFFILSSWWEGCSCCGWSSCACGWCSLTLPSRWKHCWRMCVRFRMSSWKETRLVFFISIGLSWKVSFIYHPTEIDENWTSNIPTATRQDKCLVDEWIRHNWPEFIIHLPANESWHIQLLMRFKAC